MPREQALNVLNSGRGDRQPTDAQITQWESARAAVEKRPEGIDQGEVIKDFPAVLKPHVAALQIVAPNHFRDGWRVAMVDLHRISSFQPTVYTDSAVERVAGLDIDDPAALASVTLPLETETKQDVQFDPGRNLFIFSSRNPNLRVVQPFFPQQPGGPAAFGFVVSVTPSFMQVARYGGRFILHDGYHRAHGLLTCGARWVPALVRDFGSGEFNLPAGMLPHEEFAGPRPPILLDYSDDVAAAEVTMPAWQKMVVIQALELQPRV